MVPNLKEEYCQSNTFLNHRRLMRFSSPTHDTDLRFSRRVSGSGDGILALAAAALRLAADSIPPGTESSPPVAATPNGGGDGDA